MFDTKKLALFLGGVVFGSAGFKVLSSKDAKKVYTQTTAAVLRMKDCTMQTVNKVQEEAGDILADAKAINESRAAEAVFIASLKEHVPKNSKILWYCLLM